MNVPAKLPTPRPALPDLTAWQAGALRRFARDFEKSRGESANRIDAADDLLLAKGALSPEQYAVIEMVAGRGSTISNLVSRTGRKAADLAALLASGATKLARHYEGAAQA